MQYLLDAKFCVYQIFKQSFQTLQSLEDNAAKYLNINPGQKRKNSRKYRMPNKLEDWVTLVFSQEFIDKVKTYEDYNFMGLFIFDRLEMTFSYA